MNEAKESKLVEVFGVEICQLMSEYIPILEMLANDENALKNIEIPSVQIDKEDLKNIMLVPITMCFSDVRKIKDLSMLKMILDFIPLRGLRFDEISIDFLSRYDIDDLIKINFDLNYLTKSDKYVTNLNELKKLRRSISETDFCTFMKGHDFNIVEKYGIDVLLKYGIEDLEELSESTNDLYKVSELLKQRPIELINMGVYSNAKLDFIKKYGIDNIIALDRETNGMFSHEMWNEKNLDKDIYLTMFVFAERKMPLFEVNGELTYEEFKNRMYEILLHTRDEEGVLTYRAYIDYYNYNDCKYYPNYDFIQGKFREEHSEIFIDETYGISEEIKKKFYSKNMSARDIRNCPEIMLALYGKDLTRVFYNKVIVKKENSKIEMNIAEFLSNKLGQMGFLNLCAEYGRCLDGYGLEIDENISPDNANDLIEEAIYIGIIEYGMHYFEDMPSSFKKKHPDLFLGEEVSEILREKFYRGELTYEDVREHPELKEILSTKNISVGFGIIKNGRIKEESTSLNRCGKLRKNVDGINNISPLWLRLSVDEIMYFAEKYGSYLENINAYELNLEQSLKEKEAIIQKNIEENIMRRISLYNENVPDFFKQNHPEMFLSENAPEELKRLFYDNMISGRNRRDTKDISFTLIKEHPEWKKYLEGKELSRAFSEDYWSLFQYLNSDELLKLGMKSPEVINLMVENGKENILAQWYKATEGKFVPHHVVMLNFSLDEIDMFLQNGKKWSRLMKIDDYNLNDNGKTAILKLTYAMGVFHGNDDGFRRTMKLFTDIPQELSKEEYNIVIGSFYNGIDYKGVCKKAECEEKWLIEKSYVASEEGKYILKLDKQRDRESVKIIRKILESAKLPRILTPEKAHKMFDSFEMIYNPDFVKFFNDNVDVILSDSQYIKDISAIQRQFVDIVVTNIGRNINLKVAQDYIKNVAYTEIEVGNEEIAEQAKIAGYSQNDFEVIQKIFNEGEKREFSCIPRICGEVEGFSYEMLRLDDPLALTIGTLTDCCQELHGAGQTCMIHSATSPDGRIFCVRDSERRIVAQSWVWRNQSTICFDNIEVPERIFELYGKQKIPNGWVSNGRKVLMENILNVYKQATCDLIQKDKKTYDELLMEGKITKQQYIELVLRKVTIGLGYNDIASAIKEDKALKIDRDGVRVRQTENIEYIYSDASTQYIITKRGERIESDEENLAIYRDDIPIYDEKNMNERVLWTVQRMEKEWGRARLQFINRLANNEHAEKSKMLISEIAQRYGFEPQKTKIMATRRVALIYNEDKEKIKIGDLLYVPINEDLPVNEKNEMRKHILHQIKRALEQLSTEIVEFDISILNSQQKQIVKSVLHDINKEDVER